jgi:hypothetical protein
LRHAACAAIVYCRLPEAQIVSRELVDCRTAHQFHVALEFTTHEAEGSLHANLARDGQSIKLMATEADGFGANRERLQRVTAALDAPIHQHVDAIA